MQTCICDQLGKDQADYHCYIAHEGHVLSVRTIHSRYILNFLLWV